MLVQLLALSHLLWSAALLCAAPAHPNIVVILAEAKNLCTEKPETVARLTALLDQLRDAGRSRRP
ncbi:MAG: hypothetical protein WCS99_12585 [Limisphaerales bacterium]